MAVKGMSHRGFHDLSFLEPELVRRDSLLYRLRDNLPVEIKRSCLAPHA